MLTAHNQQFLLVINKNGQIMAVFIDIDENSAFFEHKIVKTFEMQINNDKCVNLIKQPAQE